MSIELNINNVNSCQCQNSCECSLVHLWKCFSDAVGYKSYDVYFVLGFYFLKSLFTKAEIWISLSAISPLSFPKVLRSWSIPTPHWPVVKLTETAYLGRGLQQLFWPLFKGKCVHFTFTLWHSLKFHDPRIFLHWNGLYIYSLSRCFYPKRLTNEVYNKQFIIRGQWHEKPV